jgi:hypothetical protein
MYLSRKRHIFRQRRGSKAGQIHLCYSQEFAGTFVDSCFVFWQAENEAVSQTNAEQSSTPIGYTEARIAEQPEPSDMDAFLAHCMAIIDDNNMWYQNPLPFDPSLEYFNQDYTNL